MDLLFIAEDMNRLLTDIHIYIIIVVAIPITDISIIFISIIFIIIPIIFIIIVVDIIKRGGWSTIPGGGRLVIVVGDRVTGQYIQVCRPHRRPIRIQLAVDEHRGGAPRHAVSLPLEQLKGGVGHALREGHHDRTGFQPTSLEQTDREIDRQTMRGLARVRNCCGHLYRCDAVRGKKVISHYYPVSIHPSIHPLLTHHVTERPHEEVVEARRVREHQVPVAPVVVQE